MYTVYKSHNLIMSSGCAPTQVFSMCFRETFIFNLMILYRVRVTGENVEEILRILLSTQVKVSPVPQV